MPEIAWLIERAEYIGFQSVAKRLEEATKKTATLSQQSLSYKELTPKTTCNYIVLIHKDSLTIIEVHEWGVSYSSKFLLIDSNKSKYCLL